MIHGHLITLRAIEREDLDALWRWSNDPEVMYFWAEPHKTMSRDELESRYGGGLSASTGRAHWLLITTRDEAGRGETIGRGGRRSPGWPAPSSSPDSPSAR